MIPKSRINKVSKGNSKVICDGCKKLMRVRHIIQFKGKFLCSVCQQKLESTRLQRSVSKIGKPFYTLQQALNKIYTVRTYGYGREKNYISSVISVSNVLAGKKVKLTLVE